MTSDAILFTVVFGGLFVLRIIAATIVFLVLLPKGDQCPLCDDPTLRVESFLFGRVMPWFRKSWCLTCGWTGLLRTGPLTETPATREPAARR
ncbi:MAG: hypothetical protein H7066_18720 [Cytophagaceae bacterium]|nr:hypothetical protein [Gemmatimonadaceae bacterium]